MSETKEVLTEVEIEGSVEDARAKMRAIGGDLFEEGGRLYIPSRLNFQARSHLGIVKRLVGHE